MSGDDAKAVALRRAFERSKYDRVYYSTDYWGEGPPGSNNDPGAGLRLRARFKYLAELLEREFEFESLLDAGSGQGLLLEMLGQPRRLLGLDFSMAAAELYKESIQTADYQRRPVIVAGVEAVPVKDASFDLVFCSDVLEHLPDFDALPAVEELARVTARYLVLTINLDNPCLYHPTILPRETWHGMLMGTGRLQHLLSREKKVQEAARLAYPEYDFFVYEKLPAIG